MVNITTFNNTFLMMVHIKILQVLISTSPFAPKTHWEQTLFTFPDFVTIEEGQEVDGSIEITMLEYPNHRHINVRLSIPAIGLNKLYAY